MLMGIDIEGISIVVFVRVMNMLHYVVQGKSSKCQLFKPLTSSLFSLFMSFSTSNVKITINALTRYK